MALSNWEEIVLVIIFFFFFLFMFLYVISLINRSQCNDAPHKGVVLDVRTLKTGDIVGIGYSHMGGSFVSSFSRSVWTHTGIVYIDPKTKCPYIIEGCHYPEKDYKGVVKIPFSKWYRYNKNQIIGLKRYTGPEIDCEKFHNLYLDYKKNIRLEGIGPSWGKFLVNRKYFDYKLNKTYTCMELTIMFFQELDVFNKEKLPCCYFPADIMNDNVPLASGVTFSKTVTFSLQKLEKKLISLEKKKLN